MRQATMDRCQAMAMWSRATIMRSGDNRRKRDGTQTSKESYVCMACWYAVRMKNSSRLGHSRMVVPPSSLTGKWEDEPGADGVYCMLS